MTKVRVRLVAAKNKQARIIEIFDDPAPEEEGSRNCRHENKVLVIASLRALNHLCGCAFGLLDDFAVEQMHGPVSVLGESWIVGNHADGSAFTM